MDLIRRIVRRAGEMIELQPREFLEVLMRNKGKVVTRTMLLERVWDFHFDPKTSVVETHISRLRTKVDKPFQKKSFTPFVARATALTTTSISSIARQSVSQSYSRCLLARRCWQA